MIDIDGRPVEILLVEDNEDDIVIIEESLTEAKLLNVVQVVRNGEEAMAYLKRESPYQNAELPGLVLLDINMPRMNGLEVLREIKKDPELRHIPVVMLTMSEREVDILESYAGGACSYISKPVDFDKLKEVVRQFALYWTLVARVPSSKREDATRK